MARTLGKSSKTGGNQVSNPVASYESKKVVLHAERHDPVIINNIYDTKDASSSIPEKFDVVQRIDSFFGPDLRLKAETGANFRLTAPGPGRHLLLWDAQIDTDGFCEGWSVIAEVGVEFGDDLPSYEICPGCEGEIKSAAHERAAIFGFCNEK